MLRGTLSSVESYRCSSDTVSNRVDERGREDLRRQVPRELRPEAIVSVAPVVVEDAGLEDRVEDLAGEELVACLPPARGASRGGGRAEAVSVKHSTRGRAYERHGEGDVDDAGSTWVAEQGRE